MAPKKDKEVSSKAVDLLEKRLKREANKKAGKEKKETRGKPFKDGPDPRRNMKGSGPRTSTLLRDFILDMFKEEIQVVDPLNPSPQKTNVTKLYWMLNRMMLGKQSADHSEILNRGFGKVVDETRNLSEIDNFIMANIDLFTDGQIERLQKGEDKMTVLGEVLRDAQEVLKQNKK